MLEELSSDSSFGLIKGTSTPDAVEKEAISGQSVLVMTVFINFESNAASIVHWINGFRAIGSMFLPTSPFEPALAVIKPRTL